MITRIASWYILNTEILKQKGHLNKSGWLLEIQWMTYKQSPEDMESCILCEQTQLLLYKAQWGVSYSWCDVMLYVCSLPPLAALLDSVCR